MLVRTKNSSRDRKRKPAGSKQLKVIRAPLRKHENINSHLKSFDVLFDEAKKRMLRKELSEAERSLKDCINQKINY